MSKRLILAGLVSLAATPAFAGEPCRKAKDMVRMAQAIYGAEAELTDIVTPKVKLEVSGTNGHPTPSHMMYRHAGTEVQMPIVDGELQGLDQALSWSKDGEICRLIDGQMAPTVEGDTTSVSISFDFPFKRTDGQFTYDEIREGAKDGSKVMKGVAPGGLGFVVPGLKSLQIFPAAKDGPVPVATFTRKGQAVSVPVTRYADGQFIRLKDIKSAKVDALRIDGAYRMDAGFKFDPEKYAEAEARRVAKLAVAD